MFREFFEQVLGRVDKAEVNFLSLMFLYFCGYRLDRKKSRESIKQDSTVATMLLTWVVTISRINKLSVWHEREGLLQSWKLVVVSGRLLLWGVWSTALKFFLPSWAFLPETATSEAWLRTSNEFLSVGTSGAMIAGAMGATGATTPFVDFLKSKPLFAFFSTS